jgi:hypothetical protein
MEQAGKFDAAGEIGDFDASYARRAEPPDDSPSGIAIGDRREVTAVKPDILQGAGIERVQFPAMLPSVARPAAADESRLRAWLVARSAPCWRFRRSETGPSQYGPARGRRRVPSGEKKSESSLARWL